MESIHSSSTAVRFIHNLHLVDSSTKISFFFFSILKLQCPKKFCRKHVRSQSTAEVGDKAWLPPSGGHLQLQTRTFFYFSSKMFC